VMNAFSPLMTHPESVRPALVSRERMSLPRPPSVRAYDARSPWAYRGSTHSLRLSEPYNSMILLI
jgi:hypothetical protein